MENRQFKLKHHSYTPIERLGSGSQGAIWKVRRTDDTSWVMKSVLTIGRDKQGRDTAIPPRQIESNKKRLQDEITFLTQLKNAEKQFIVRCLDSGFIDDPIHGELPAFIMPYYPHTLEHKMPPYPIDSKNIPSFADYMKWIKQAIIALQTTHNFTQRGSKKVFIHRDIKAENMMLTEQGDIRLIDFGIARETTLQGDANTRSFTETSAAPEQIFASRYDAHKGYYEIGTHSDMYALGMVIYRLLTGAMTTDAQHVMLKDITQRNHIISLNQGDTGKLGKLGGLEDHEYSTLKVELTAAIDDMNSVDTVISEQDNDNSLPNVATIAESFADEVRLLLHADYKQRPTANRVLKWINTLQQAQSPQLENLKIHLGAQQTKVGEKIRVQISTQGKGLPVHSKWINVSINGELIKEAFDPLPTQHSRFGFLAQKKQRWKITLPPINEAGKFRLRTEAIVNGKSVSDQAELSIVNHKTTKKKFIIAGLFIALLGAGIVAKEHWPIPPNCPEKNILKQWHTDLEGENSTKQFAAWRKLKKQMTTSCPQGAAEIVDNFEQKSLSLFDSNTLSKQKKAIPRLTLMANSGTPSAMQRLGIAHEEGKAVKQHWGKAWEWYQKAGEDGSKEKKRLEAVANTILQSERNTARTRQLKQAYQVAERVAQHEPAGDPAQRWMEYRYRAGDGVKTNKKRADYWQRRYEGKEPTNNATWNLGDEKQ